MTESLMLLSAMSFLGWLGSLGLYGYYWAKYGSWAPMHLLDALCKVQSCAADSWVRSPSDWLGIHDLLAATSLPTGLFAVGCILLWVGVASEG